ncbi:globin [Oesophagostomum dentatum]|uniref:Globin n=1 Tax=Oesophagostomum dentatum TaxID=61180 RepID=A0A0B1TNF9_OESDE|nr:globin [Oesophagostomum dentatum]
MRSSSKNTGQLSSFFFFQRLKVKNVEQWEPNAYEKELLRRTWSDEFEFLYELGSAIYTYIFEHNPNCKQLFPQLIKYGENWKDSREFRAQALKFVQTLSQVVKNIYHKERLEPFLYGIGQLHCKYASRGFKPEYWEDFQVNMLLALEQTHFYTFL